MPRPWRHQISVAKWPVPFLYRDNLPLKLGNITGRNITSRASLRNVFHWLSSLFKGYKSALLKSKRDTGTEKTKTNKKKNKERYHLKWCQSFFVFFECISCSPTWTQCTTWMIICLMTSCKLEGLLHTCSQMSLTTAAALQSERCMKNIVCNTHITRTTYFVFLCHAYYKIKVKLFVKMFLLSMSCTPVIACTLPAEVSLLSGF